VVIQCMEPISVPEVIKDFGFIHQIKWDGIRGVSSIEDGHMTLFTRKGGVCTAAYPELAALPEQVSAKQVVLDGELVVFTDGRPSFYNVLRRSLTRNETGVKRLAARYPVKYIVFDILFLDGEDLRGKPLAERQRILKERFISSPAAAVTDSFEDGEALFAIMRQKNMEGIVSKRTESRYIPGKRHSDWFKTKIMKKLLCIVTGVQLKNSLPASLALGVYREGVLTAVGAVSTGLKQDDWVQIRNYMQREKTGEEKDVVWIRPSLTCWVRFAEWTDHMTLRHPVLLGFSNKDAADAEGEEFML
jgi:bifunctional non-homologous end joining protein LigD